MLRKLPAIAGVLLGLGFVAAAATFLLGLVPEQDPPPAGSAAESFFAAFGPTGYLKLVKVCELLGGILVAIPKTRNLGLLILVPIVVNILAFHALVMKGQNLLDPMLLVFCALTAYLLWVERGAIAGLVHRRANPA